jgi:hypothetical protein
VEAGKSFLLVSSILSLYLQLGTGGRADLVKKDTPAKVERSKKGKKCFFVKFKNP